MFINYLQGFHLKAISGNTSKHDISIPRKTLVAGFHFSKFRCCKPTTFPKNSNNFFLEFGKLFHNKHNNLW